MDGFIFWGGIVAVVALLVWWDYRTMPADGKTLTPLPNWDEEAADEDSSSMQVQEIQLINPASGLMMNGGVDAAGNAFGDDSMSR